MSRAPSSPGKDNPNRGRQDRHEAADGAAVDADRVPADLQARASPTVPAQLNSAPPASVASVKKKSPA